MISSIRTTRNLADALAHLRRPSRLRDSMASSSEIATRYFTAVAAHDLDAATACWAPGAVGRIVGQRELIAPDGIREYYAALFDAFPDFDLEILNTTTYRDRCAVRWLARATFAGPGRFQGLEHNGAQVAIEGCDVLTSGDGLIIHSDAYFDSGDLARQLGLLPKLGSSAHARLTGMANVGGRLRRLAAGTDPAAIAAGVWVVRGAQLRNMNVYLLADEGGVTVFDAGISAMAPALALACARLGGARRVVLGHADADHRGAAGAIGAPVYCHEAEREAAESPSSIRDYYPLERLAPWARPVYPWLLRSWDGGRVAIQGTLAEGDEVAGFRVVHFPGHAPGLIGLFRDEDRLALVSDLVYTIDPETGVWGDARLPHPAFNWDVDQARASIRKLATLDPSVVWTGHARPVSGDVAAKLERAAGAPV
jgi:glyoxylase-like metal-dependent hydrolase (beta-lactamase superfamily II)/predicted ester cyclase